MSGALTGQRTYPHTYTITAGDAASQANIDLPIKRVVTIRHLSIIANVKPTWAEIQVWDTPNLEIGLVQGMVSRRHTLFYQGELTSYVDKVRFILLAPTEGDVYNMRMVLEG